ncbi:MAG: hypothetical protein U1F52_17545 [Burkholderiales bacterium]
MVLPSGVTSIPGNVIGRGGGALVAANPYTSSGLLTLQGGSALTPLSTLSLRHAPQMGGGAGVTVTGAADANARAAANVYEPHPGTTDVVRRNWPTAGAHPP